MVNAIAPNAPIGATRISMLIIRNSACENWSMIAEQVAPALAEMQQRDAEQHREEQHLKDLSARECADNRVRDDVQQELGGAQLLGSLRVRGDGAPDRATPDRR